MKTVVDRCLLFFVCHSSEINCDEKPVLLGLLYRFWPIFLLFFVQLDCVFLINLCCIWHGIIKKNEYRPMSIKVRTTLPAVYLELINEGGGGTSRPCNNTGMQFACMSTHDSICIIYKIKFYFVAVSE